MSVENAIINDNDSYVLISSTSSLEEVKPATLTQLCLWEIIHYSLWVYKAPKTGQSNLISRVFVYWGSVGFNILT